MADYDLIVRDARIVTAERQSEGDIAVKDGAVAALGADVKGTATREIDAAGKFVLPGGVDSHCHIEQRSGMGVMCADDFHSGTVSAAASGKRLHSLWLSEAEACALTTSRPSAPTLCVQSCKRKFMRPVK